MASKLQKADTLLNDPDADAHRLVDVLSDIEIALTTNNNLDGNTRREYVRRKILLEERLGPQKTKEKEAKAEQKTQQYANKLKYLEQKAVAVKNEQQKYFEQRVTANKIEQNRSKAFSMEMITHYSKPEFFPDIPKAGDMFWLKQSDYRFNDVGTDYSLRHRRGTLNFKGEKPRLWIGDLRIDSVEKIPRKDFFGEGLFYETIINATPIIYFDRVEALYAFYNRKERKPLKIGELGWTSDKPEIARPRSSIPQMYITSRDDIIRHNEAYINSISQYLIKIRGFVIFLDNVSTDDLNRKVFDVEYLKASKKGNSGQGRLVTNTIRELVTQNIAEYRRLENEQK